MPIYSYHAKDSQGLSLRGIVEASIQDEAISLLRKKELHIISIKETLVKDIKEQKVKLEDLVVFSHQLAALIDAGITLVYALQLLKEQTKNKVLAFTIIDIRDQILNGSSLHRALAKHPKVFSPLYINLVRTGEISGLLNETLNRIATYLEKSSSLNRRARSAMVYPTVVISIALIITTVLLLKVVPVFEHIFTELSGELPLPTRFLILISLIVRKFFLPVLVLFFIIAAVIKKYISSPHGRYKFDKMLFRLPIYGDLIQKVTIARFARTLATLVKSAIPIIHSLHVVARTCGNLVVEEAIVNAARAVRHGESISDPLSRSGVFPAMVSGMIKVGEQSGQLEKMLTKIADLYEEEVTITINNLAAMTEPLVIAILGIFIGGIVIALFMPIFRVASLIH